jgi:DNA ligase-associated metallophosphoesterase
LTNQRVAFWEKEKALILADLHLGKAAHFRKNGIAMPAQVSEQDMQRLENLIRHYGAEQVIIVGDLVHASANKEVGLFFAVTQKFPGTRFILVRGNHDRFPERQFKKMGIYSVQDFLLIRNIRFVHHHRDMDTGCISGHLHPGIKLPLPAGQVMRFPCYVLTGKQFILPAFSRFTGLDTSALPPKAVCYAFYPHGFFKIG